MLFKIDYGVEINLLHWLYTTDSSSGNESILNETTFHSDFKMRGEIWQYDV